MASWTLAPSLIQLRKEIDQRWPNRDRRSDGAIGDAAHSARYSEHNPDEFGIVRAVDIDVDGVNVSDILETVIGDKRVHYVIFNRKIWSRTNNWISKTYYGSNPHTGHIHISIRNNGSERTSEAVRHEAANDTSLWFDSLGQFERVLKLGSKGTRVTALQKGLRLVFPAYRYRVAPRGRLLAVDGIYGGHTEGWVKEFQKRTGLVDDGIVGDKTVAKLARHGIKV